MIPKGMSHHVRVLRPRLPNGRLVSLRDVMRKGRYATLLLQGAVLYEYLLGVFWVTDFRAEDPRSVKVAKLHELPPEHWYHLPTCDCGACGFRES
jgi:hypothetical protein